MSATLCVVFNHAYPKNINIIKKIYENRFERIIFVIPFERNLGENVVTSYRGSYSFQGMIVDVASKLREVETDYYVFIQDDVLLSPEINERNVGEFFGIGPKMAFLPEFYALAGPIYTWVWTPRVVWRLLHSQDPLGGSGAEMAIKHLPPRHIAEQKAHQHNIQFSPITYENVDKCMTSHFSSDSLSRDLNSVICNGLFHSGQDNKCIHLPYPFVFGVSDFFVIGKEVFDEFVHFQGVCSGMDIFAEVAIPTGLMVCADRVIRSQDINRHADWVWNDREKINVDYVRQRFAEGDILVHPVKLSKMSESLDELIELMEK